MGNCPQPGTGAGRNVCGKLGSSDALHGDTCFIPDRELVSFTSCRSLSDLPSSILSSKFGRSRLGIPPCYTEGTIPHL